LKFLSDLVLLITKNQFQQLKTKNWFIHILGVSAPNSCQQEANHLMAGTGLLLLCQKQE
jgi:hypothetical protein